MATALRVATRSRRDFVARLAKDLGHYLRHASRRAIDLASNAAHERYLEVPFNLFYVRTDHSSHLHHIDGLAFLDVAQIGKVA